MNFMFERQEQYLTSERSKCSCHAREHKIHIFELTCSFFLLCRHTNNGAIEDFPKISDHVPKILQNLSEGRTNVTEHFPKISDDCRRLPNIAEDFRGRPEDISIIHQRI